MLYFYLVAFGRSAFGSTSFFSQHAVQSHWKETGKGDEGLNKFLNSLMIF